MGEKATCDVCGAEVSSSNLSRHKKKAHGVAAGGVAAAATVAQAAASKPAAKRSAAKKPAAKAKGGEVVQLSPERRKLAKVMKENVVPYRAYEKAHLDGKAGKLSEDEVRTIKAANQEGHKLYWRAYEADRALRKAEAAQAA